MGPYLIIKDFRNNSYQLDLPSRLKCRGIHDVFHSLLLRVNEPNDDRLFPGRADNQIFELEDQEGEWAIEKIIGHKGKGRSAIFECHWKTGDRTWVPHDLIAHLGALAAYLEALDLEDIDSLDDETGVLPPDDPQIFIGHLCMVSPQNSRNLKTSHSSPVNTSLSHSLANSLPTMSATFDPSSTRAVRNSLQVLDTDANKYHFFHNSQLHAIFIHDQCLHSGKFQSAQIGSGPAHHGDGPPFLNLNQFAPKPVIHKTDQKIREERVQRGSMMLVLENLLDEGGDLFRKGGKRRFKAGEGRNFFMGKKHKHSFIIIPLDSDDELEGASEPSAPVPTTTTTSFSSNPPPTGITAAQPAPTKSASATPASADNIMGAEAQPGPSSSIDKLKFKKTRSSKAASSGKGKKPAGASDTDELMDYHTGEEGY
ncbi:hypothetical protein NLI96_g11164 [Meripilus lineatus]|uniref:Chromo domain-containing protein n=1 Tax=Meripilus lineatus TaxID=2056292 RepID=A0AAD5UWI2_9APHY|nr:hypothetical protein NLI96_g11164 [Physisporinus lineatus]